ncbi:permease [Helicobacter sp. CLO-3]|uniref:LptF/LptG family permease n=1 Tax=unclassified Helicobacter TaxID=2593540 RepID=UPI0008058FC4|nr:MULTISPECIES: LptF/LptG family permease [unclassified Helicobacter]OBV29077.1 permease [Helicobacter sp. CLO-3]OHU81953.1 permease [Helicobacter sp. CLO-3]
MKLRLFLFIGRYYLRYFAVIFIALGLFFVSIDSLKYIDDFADSANLVVLFFVYDFMYAMNFTLPISLLLSMAICYLSLIKSNQYTALLALGYSKGVLLRPVLWISLFFSFVYIGLNATPFAYAQEKVEKFFASDSSAPTTDLFVKYNQSYVYFGSINLVRQASKIRVFELNDDKSALKSFVQARQAFFDDDFWILQDAISQDMPNSWNLGAKGVRAKTSPKLPILKDFNPKVLDSFSQAKPSISIIDAIDSLRLLKAQKISSEKIRAVLYALILVPLFVPFVAIILAYYTPSLARYGNLYLLGFGFIVFSLLVWGMFFALSQFSITGIVFPEVGVVLPFALLIGVSLWYYARLNKRA